MTTIGSSTHEFLAALATVLQRGEIKDPAAFKSVAEGIAADIAGKSKIKAADLVEQVPPGWGKDPAGYGTKKQAEAFLEVASPVFNVDTSAAAKVAKAHLVRGKDADLLIEMNRADAAAKAGSPLMGRVIDLASIGAYELRKELEAALADPVFAQAMGLTRGHRFSELAGEIAGALHYARPADKPDVEVRAGGVVVGGPQIREAYAKMPFGNFFVQDAKVKLGNLAANLVELALVREGLGEIREEISGARIACGHGVPTDATPLYVFMEDGRVGLGFGIDVAKLRAYERSDFDDATIVKRVGGLLRARFGEMMTLVAAGVPPATAADRRKVAESPMLIGLLEKAAKAAPAA